MHIPTAEGIAPSGAQLRALLEPAHRLFVSAMQAGQCEDPIKALGYSKALRLALPSFVQQVNQFRSWDRLWLHDVVQSHAYHSLVL